MHCTFCLGLLIDSYLCFNFTHFALIISCTFLSTCWSVATWFAQHNFNHFDRRANTALALELGLSKIVVLCFAKSLNTLMMSCIGFPVTFRTRSSLKCYGLRLTAYASEMSDVWLLNTDLFCWICLYIRNLYSATEKAYKGTLYFWVHSLLCVRCYTFIFRCMFFRRYTARFLKLWCHSVCTVFVVLWIVKLTFFGPLPRFSLSTFGITLPL